MLHANPDADSQHGHDQPKRTPRGPEQEKAQHGETRRDSVQHDDDLAVGHAMLQKLVVDVLAIGGEDRAPADQAANDGEHSLQNRQTEETIGMATATIVGAF